MSVCRVRDVERVVCVYRVRDAESGYVCMESEGCGE